MFIRMFALLLVCALVADECRAKRDSKGRDRKGKGRGTPMDSTDEMKDLKDEIEEIKNRLKEGDESCGSKVHFYFHAGEHDEMDDDDHDHDHDHGHDHGHDDDEHVHVHLHHPTGFHHPEIAHFGHRAFPSSRIFTAHCEFHGEEGIEGHADFYERFGDRHANISFEFSHLGAGDSEFNVHIHQYGDCSNPGAHYDPFDDEVDVGDLGTLHTNGDGEVHEWKNETVMSIFSQYSVAGRSMVVHEASGASLACCLIARSKSIGGEEPMFHHGPHGLVEIAHFGESGHSGHGHGRMSGPPAKGTMKVELGEH